MLDKAVRIHARQQMPNYRKPSSFLIKESYPLPPYSTVIGMVHNMCGWKSYHPMMVSVQGCFASTVSDYATNYAFGAIPLDRAQLKVDCGGGKQAGVARMPRSYELLTDVELVLHIMPEDEAELEEILNAAIDPPIYPSLGRYEDLLQIDSAEIVALTKAEDGVAPRYDAYVPVDSIDSFFGESITGTIYGIRKVFQYDDGKRRSDAADKKSSRVWRDVVRVRHVCANSALGAAEGVLFDRKYNDAVFPA